MSLKSPLKSPPKYLKVTFYEQRNVKRSLKLSNLIFSNKRDSFKIQNRKMLDQNFSTITIKPWKNVSNQQKLSPIHLILFHHRLNVSFSLQNPKSKVKTFQNICVLFLPPPFIHKQTDAPSASNSCNAGQLGSFGLLNKNRLKQNCTSQVGFGSGGRFRSVRSVSNEDVFVAASLSNSSKMEAG